MKAVAQESSGVDILKEIYDNATDALETAELLIASSRAVHALHFSIICWEECSKYLLAYCKDHLPEKQFRSRYSHVSKYSLATGIYYLNGGFSVTHVLEELRVSGAVGEGSEVLEALVAATLDHIGFGNPEALANSLLEYLSSENTPEQEAALRAAYSKLEKLRTQSVYVDFSEDLSLQSAPSQIAQDDVRDWLEHARLGVGMLRFLRGDRPNLRALVAAMPASIRKDVEKRSQEFISKMAQPSN